MSRPPFLAAALALVLASACADEHERNWIFEGEWIAVDGWGREAEETCAGTFDHLDTYAGVLAREFGVDEPLGVFRWASNAHVLAGDLPCPPNTSCVHDGEAYSSLLPEQHEIVHMANDVTGMCPSVLAEGLAVYYDTRGNRSASGDIELLSARLAKPHTRAPYAEYPIAGRFAAFLVHEFGLAKVLDFCARTGPGAHAKRFASAMQDVFGASPAQLVEQLAAEPDACNQVSHYQSGSMRAAKMHAHPMRASSSPTSPFIAPTRSAASNQRASARSMANSPSSGRSSSSRPAPISSPYRTRMATSTSRFR